MRLLSVIVLVVGGQCAVAQENFGASSSPFLGFGTSIGASHLGQTGQPDIWAQTFGLSGAILIAGDEERPIFLEFGWSALHGTSRSQTGQSMATQTPFAFATRVSPNGTLSLTTFTDPTGAYATSISMLTDSSGDQGSISSTTFSPPGGQTTVFAYTPTDVGGLYSSLVTDGTAGIAGAVGALFDDTGAVVMADGNSIGTQVVTTRHDRVDFNDGSLRLSTLVPLENGWTFVPRGGLVLQSFTRSTTLTQTIDVDDGFAADPPTPSLSIAQNTNLRTNMTGLSLGAGFSRQLPDGWRVSIGADVGATRGRTVYAFTESVNLDATQFSNISGPTGRVENIARMGRASVGISRQFAQGGVFSLNLYSEAITGIPYLERQDIALVTPVSTNGGRDVDLSVSGETNQDYQIRYGDIKKWGVSVSLIWRF